MKVTLLTIILMFPAFAFTCSSCRGEDNPEIPQEEESTVSRQDIVRAMQLFDAAMTNYFDQGDGMKMARYFNPFTETKSSEIGSVWMYTASIEAAVTILEALDAQKRHGDSKYHDQKFSFYKSQLSKLYDGLQYYKGTFSLISYTQTASWSAYAVNRASSPGTADMGGVLNVYDDQMWLAKELAKAYKVTGEAKYLAEAESLAAYVIDGWDCTLGPDGKENGGITWGPGYVTKHSCSNGPMVSPLVWLSETYQGKDDAMEVGYVNPDGTRGRKSMKKSDCYLEYAKKIYSYQKEHLLRPDNGVYDDMMGGYKTGGGKVEYETVGGVSYRKNTALYDRVGPAISYNSGTMLSGAADLYRVTGEAAYLSDLKALSGNSFSYFAKLGTVKEGLYTYDITGFRNWFNCVLMRGFVAVLPFHKAADTAVKSFQDNLDHAWTHHLKGDMLPTSLLGGWNMDKAKNGVEGMFTFAFASEYAELAKYSIEK